MIPDTLISVRYTLEQVRLHAQPKGYGGKGGKWAPAAAALAREYGAQSVLDYGCGQGSLGLALRGQGTFALALRGAPTGLDVREYDPAVAGKDVLPEPADLVICTDVLEHIEPEKLDGVLAHLASLVRKAAFVVVATRPSGKTLTDGRNAHLILEQADWWDARVGAAGFTVHPGPASPLDKPSREWVAVLTR